MNFFQARCSHQSLEDIFIQEKKLHPSKLEKLQTSLYQFHSSRKIETEKIMTKNIVLNINLRNVLVRLKSKSNASLHKARVNYWTKLHRMDHNKKKARKWKYNCESEEKFHFILKLFHLRLKLLEESEIEINPGSRSAYYLHDESYFSSLARRIFNQNSFGNISIEKKNIMIDNIFAMIQSSSNKAKPSISKEIKNNSLLIEKRTGYLSINPIKWLIIEGFGLGDDINAEMENMEYQISLGNRIYYCEDEGGAKNKVYEVSNKNLKTSSIFKNFGGFSFKLPASKVAQNKYHYIHHGYSDGNNSEQILYHFFPASIADLFVMVNYQNHGNLSEKDYSGCNFYVFCYSSGIVGTIEQKNRTDANSFQVFNSFKFLPLSNFCISELLHYYSQYYFAT